MNMTAFLLMLDTTYKYTILPWHLLKSSTQAIPWEQMIKTTPKSVPSILFWRERSLIDISMTKTNSGPIFMGLFVYCNLRG
jgi:hypothetical protein